MKRITVSKCKETVFETTTDKTDYMNGIVTATCGKCKHEVNITFPLVESMYEEMVKGQIKKKVVEGVFWNW